MTGKLMQKYNVNHAISEKETAILERDNRTLKNMMWKKFSLQGKYKWVYIIPQIVAKYNNRNIEQLE